MLSVYLEKRGGCETARDGLRAPAGARREFMPHNIEILRRVRV